MSMFSRVQKLPKKSFFLFGPRATGKSTWLKQVLPNALVIDLLRNDIYFKILSDPSHFRSIVQAQSRDRWIVLDEVQRIPELLNEVHSLIEGDGYRFALTGSSARKLKRGQANLLAGRAVVKAMFPAVREEFGKRVSIEEVLRWGCLPNILMEPESRLDTLEAYAGTYLREEIKEEALTRNIGSFVRFLEVAAIANAQVTNLANISRDAQVGRPTVQTYFEILTDTLIAKLLPAWTPRARVKEVSHPKLYFFDTGVLRAIQGRLRDRPTDVERGHLFETYLFHELSAFTSYKDVGGQWFYWSTPNQVEVDFIWQRSERVIAIEAKASTRWRDDYDDGLTALQNSKVKPKHSMGVYLGSERLKRSWGLVYPIGEFLYELYHGKLGSCFGGD